MEDLLAVKKDLVNETKRAETAVKAHVSNEMRQLQIMETAQLQKRRLFGCLKYPEMNQRFNDIKMADETTFNRIFQSYDAGTSYYQGPKQSISQFPDKTSSHINAIWENFVTWLRSNDSLFWIQGKPGCGKSTLVKFLITHPKTKRILDEWSLDTVIVSHFLWKVGSRMQKNLKGLFCALLHQILTKIADISLIDFFPHAFPNIKEKEYSGDWSVEELEKLLFAILKHCRSPICIFIDGLDEISEEDGPYQVIRLVHGFKDIKLVKLCVACRHEWPFRKHFKDVATLRLHQLTAPDMLAFVHKELRPFLEEGSISMNFEKSLAERFIEKAEGVFLWLTLALKSVKSGLDKGDCEEELSSRLEQLPNELENLYADMWTRLNEDSPIYRHKAALYLRLAMDSQLGEDLQYTFCVMTAAEPAIQTALLDLEKAIDTEDLLRFCRKSRDEILTRCVGLLDFVQFTYVYGRSPYTELTPLIGISKMNQLESILDGAPDEMEMFLSSRVQLTHRTAYEFLKNSEPGQRILGYDKSHASPPDLTLELMKSSLCQARVMSWTNVSPRYRSPGDPHFIFLHLQRMATGLTASIDDQQLNLPLRHGIEDKYTKRIIYLLESVNQFMERGMLHYNWPPSTFPLSYHTLLVRGAGLNTALEDYALAAIQKWDASLASKVLSELWFYELNLLSPPTTVVEALFQRGAVTTAYNLAMPRPTDNTTHPIPRFAYQRNPMQNFLQETCIILNLLLDSDHKSEFQRYQDYILAMAAIMANNHKSLSDRVLSFATFNLVHGGLSLNYLRNSVVIEMDLAFMLSYVLAQVTSTEGRESPQIQALYNRTRTSFVSVLYVLYTDAKPSIFQVINSEAATRHVVAALFAGSPSAQSQWDFTKGQGSKEINLDRLAQSSRELHKDLPWLLEELDRKYLAMHSVDELGRQGR
jgi:hypothetical protein